MVKRRETLENENGEGVLDDEIPMFPSPVRGGVFQATKKNMNWCLFKNVSTIWDPYKDQPFPWNLGISDIHFNFQPHQKLPLAKFST